jgi:hypothetical protein
LGIEIRWIIKIKKKKQQKKQYYLDNKEQIKEQSKQWRKDNPEYDKQYYLDHKEQKKQYYKEHKEEIKQYSKQWYKDNREQKLQNDKQWRKNKYQIDPMFRLHDNISSNIRSSLRTNNLSKNEKHWEDLVGYTLEELKTHLEKQFEPWMNWNNFGKSTIPNTNWSIDHIVPLSAFNFTSTDDEEFKLAWGLDNLQPLDTYINLWIKKDRLDYYIKYPIQCN